VSSAEDLDRKLHELDVRRRAGSISLADYRKVRRSAIQALEDPHATIPHHADPVHDETNENSTPTRPLPPDLPTVPLAVKGGAGQKRILWIFVGVGALVTLAVVALLLSGSGDPTPADTAPGGASGSAAPRRAAAGPDLPQTVADQLMKSEWTDADIATFLSKWNGISPEARRAARDDAGMWLLRGETDRRLHEAVDAAALDPTPEAQSRIDRLTALQAALRPE
jgi:hypothetical protein